MSLKNRKEDRIFFTLKETKTGNENSPNLYARNGALFEGRGLMTLPNPTVLTESDKGKLGSGEHGTGSKIMAIGSPWSYKCDRPSEIGFLLCYLLGKADTNTGGNETHHLHHLNVDELELPTFGFQYGNGLVNSVFAGAVVNDCSISIPFNSGNGKIEATFNGWANGHYVSGGALTKLATGTFNSGLYSINIEPIVNAKAIKTYLANVLETSYGDSSVDFTGEDMGAGLVEISDLINSLTLTINNGMTMEEKLRAGGCGIINDWTRGVRALTLELNARKDTSKVDWDALRLARSQRAIEIQWAGAICALDLFFPVIEVNNCPEDDGTPVSQAVTCEVFQDSEKQAFIAHMQGTFQHAFDA